MFRELPYKGIDIIEIHGQFINSLNPALYQQKEPGSANKYIRC